MTAIADQRLKHTYVIGTSGTGKATFLLNLILQDIQKGEGVAVLDPHGDLIEEILTRIPLERITNNLSVARLRPAPLRGRGA